MATTELALPQIVELLAPGGAYEKGRIALRASHGVVLENAKKLVAITSAEEAEQVTNFGRLLQAATGEAEKFYKPHKAQIDAIKAPILQDEHADVDAYKAESKRLGLLMTGWMKQCREQQEIADRLAREEANRKAQEEALLRAIEVEEVEGTAAAEEVLAAPLYVPPVVTQSMQPFKPKGSVASATYKAKLDNLLVLVKAIAEGKAPIQAIEWNESWCNGQARAFREAYNIPGTILDKVDSTGFRR
jgi:hypothetical protein